MIYRKLGYDTLSMSLLLVQITKYGRNRGEEARRRRSGRREGVCSCEIGAMPDKRE